MKRANTRANQWWCSAYQKGTCTYDDDECPYGSHITKETLDKILCDNTRRRAADRERDAGRASSDPPPVERAAPKAKGKAKAKAAR